MMTITRMQQQLAASKKLQGRMYDTPESQRLSNHDARLANLAGQIKALENILGTDPEFAPTKGGETLTACECCGSVTSDVSKAYNGMSPEDETLHDYCGSCERNLNRQW